MKKLFVSLMLMAFCFVALPSIAQNSLHISAGKIKSLHLGDNMKIVLEKATDVSRDIVADEAAQQKIRFSISKGVLYIRSTDDWKDGDQLIIHVAEIETLTIGEFTSLDSDIVMTAPEMEVYVSTGSVARLKTTGKVQGFSSDGSEVTIQRLASGKEVANSF